MNDQTNNLGLDKGFALGSMMRPLSAALLLAACAVAAPIPDDAVPHILAIDKEGGARAFDIQRGGTVVDGSDYTVTNHLRQIVEGIRASGRTNILIYLFGGMNSVDSTTERAAELAQVICRSSDCYPICVNWQSSLFEAYFDHLLWIRRGVREPVMGPVLAPFYLFADIGRAFTRLPVTLVYHAYATASDTMVEPLGDDDSSDDDVTLATDKKIAAQHIRAATGADKSSTAMRALQRVVYLFGTPFRIITVPMIDACGKNAWDVMLGRTQTAFQKSYTLDPPAKEGISVAYAPPDGALALLMAEIASLCASNPQYRITIVGHSLGAMLGNEVLRRYPLLPIKNIVYMGAACSMKEGGRAILPYLRNHRDCTFYNLCLHQHADEREYMWLAFLPRGSILEWIDAFLSDPLTVNDLQLGKWKNAVRTLPTMSEDVRPQIVIKAFGINDPVYNTHDLQQPEKHTDFSNADLRFWEHAFWTIPERKH